jgi:hypothetical protein
MPEPLWQAPDRPEGKEVGKPTILRFATDDFMPQLRDVLATDPQRLGEYRLVNETWRGVMGTPTQPQTPRQLFALPFQRLAATRARINGRALPDAGRKPAAVTGTDSFPTKLYQPAHQRYYLLSSCLVCKIPGFPDRKVDTGKHELAGFVMRRLLPKDPTSVTDFKEGSWRDVWQEYAWVSSEGANSWKLMSGADANTVDHQEEVLPMFGLNFTQDDQYRRRLFAGLVPAGKREVYLGAARAESDAASGSSLTARKILLRTKVIEPWKQLLDRAAKAAKGANGTDRDGNPLPAPDKDALAAARIELQESSYFLLGDMADYLQTHLKPVWDCLVSSDDPNSLADPVQQEALEALNGIQFGTQSLDLKNAWNALAKHQAIADSLSDIFKYHATELASLDQVNTSYDPDAPGAPGAPGGFPNFVFPLADPTDDWTKLDGILTPFPRTIPPSESTDPADEEDDTSFAAKTLDQLASILARALVNVPAPTPVVPLAAKLAASPATEALQAYFVARCVYRRPACGPLHEDVVSAATDPFQLAGFFDPDAPARPIRIGLPLDTSPAGLRKFDKNTAFVLSDMLCGHVKRAKGMTFGDLVMSVLPFPFHQDLGGSNAPCKSGTVSLGTICSISIPIITICAFILLIIMVTLLDIIFHWTPFFMLCFPVKGLDGKKS